MSLFSFDNLVTKFGEALAWHCLAEIEKAAGICSHQTWGTDPEARLAHAISLQDLGCLKRAAA